MALPLTFTDWLCVPIVGFALVGWGYVCLLWIIPRSQKQGNVRTDYYSAKVSYWVIMIGLLCVASWAIMVVVVQSLTTIKAIGVGG